MTISIIYVQDALRSLNCSTYGYERETTPNLTRVAEDGSALTGISPALWTLPASVSLLTGTRPFKHGVLEQNGHVPSTFDTLPEVLPDNIDTVGITAAGYASAEFGNDRGYDEFIELHKKGREKKWLVTASEIHEEITTVLDDYAGEDLFLLVWSIEPHWPYLADCYWGSEETETQGLPLNKAVNEEDRSAIEDRYDDQIYENDRQLGNLIDTLREKGVYDDTCLFVLGDHGEGFGEGLDGLGRSLVGHRDVPYQELIEVPFVVKSPKDVAVQSDGLASLTDVFPTVCDLYGISTPAQVQGISLLENGQRRERVCVQARDEHGGVYEGVRSTDWNYFRVRNRGTIRDLVESPAGYVRSRWLIGESLLPINDGVEQKKDLSTEHPSTVATLRQKVDRTRENDLSRREGKQSSTEISAETRKHLREMGYL